MSDFLLDTNVISMLAPARAIVSSDFLNWLERMDADGRLFLPVIAIHEIEKGIALLDSKGATAKAANLHTWLDGLVSTYDDKIIAFDTKTATIAGSLEAKAVAAGHDPGMADAMIAGIAAVHGLTIITSNTKHFAPFDVAVSSPAQIATEK